VKAFGNNPDAVPEQAPHSHRLQRKTPEMVFDES
jgi:hypothetical protein